MRLQNKDISIYGLTWSQTMVNVCSQIRKRTPCDIICIWYSIVCIYLIQLIESIQFIDAEQTQKWKYVFTKICMYVDAKEKSIFWWQIWYSTVLSSMDISTIRLYNNWSQGGNGTLFFRRIRSFIHYHTLVYYMGEDQFSSTGIYNKYSLASGW